MDDQQQLDRSQASRVSRQTFIQSEPRIPVNMQAGQAAAMMGHLSKTQRLERKSAIESLQSTRRHAKRFCS